MYERVTICGRQQREERVRAYSQILGSDCVTVADSVEEVDGQDRVVDIRGTLDDKQMIPAWQEQGALIVTDALPAESVNASLDMLSSGRVLVAQRPRYDPRHQLMRRQLENGDIGDLVAIRWVSLWPQDTWLPEGATLNYAFEAMDAISALLGTPKRITAREQRLKREVPDTLFSVMVGENGAIAYLEISCAQPDGYRAERLEVVGTQGILEYNSDVNRTLRMTGQSGSTLVDAFWESPLEIMIKDYLLLAGDEDQCAAKIKELQAALQLVERTLESQNTNRPA